MTKAAFNSRAGLTPSRSGNFRRPYILLAMFVFCVVFYYFGELVDLAGWNALRWEFFYSVHDTHRLLFLAPIVYAAYFFGDRATIIIIILALATFLFRALFISPFPDPLLRMVIFIILASAIGYLTGTESQRRKRLEALVKSQSNTMLTMLERMEEGTLIIGPDYRVRFMNSSMRRDFGEGIGSRCYEYLCQLDEPCRQICNLPNVIDGVTERWRYRFPDGRTYEVLAVPYVDSDGTPCQLAILTSITQHK